MMEFSHYYEVDVSLCRRHKLDYSTMQTWCKNKKMSTRVSAHQEVVTLKRNTMSPD